MKRQASSRRERTLRVRNRAAVQCMTRCGNKQPHKKGLSPKQDRGRPPGCATFACAYKARTPDGQAASTQKQRCIVQCAQPREAPACIQDATCADASGAKEHIAPPRSWRPRLQEQKVWSARGEAGAAARREGGVHTAWRAGSGPAEAAHQAGMWGRERGEGRVRIPSSLPRLPAPEANEGS